MRDARRGSGERVFSVTGFDCVETRFFQREDQQLADMGIVIDDEDGARHGTQDHRFCSGVNGFGSGSSTGTICGSGSTGGS